MFISFILLKRYPYLHGCKLWYLLVFLLGYYLVCLVIFLLPRIPLGVILYFLRTLYRSKICYLSHPSNLLNGVGFIDMLPFCSTSKSVIFYKITWCVWYFLFKIPVQIPCILYQAFLLLTPVQDSLLRYYCLLSK